MAFRPVIDRTVMRNGITLGHEFMSVVLERDSLQRRPRFFRGQPRVLRWDHSGTLRVRALLISEGTEHFTCQ